MSSSAALAAAKKRRNVGLGEQRIQQNNKQQEHPRVREPLSVPQLVTQHDARIFKLERQRIQEAGNYYSKEDLDKIHNDFSQLIDSVSKKLDIRLENNIDNNIVSNKIEKNDKDIASINNVTKILTKNLSEIKTSNAKLHATILEQSKEIEKLKKLFSDYVMEKNSE